MEVKEYRCGCVIRIWQNEEGEIVRDIVRECKYFDWVNGIAPWIGDENECQPEEI